MYDSINPLAIPADAAMVAGYVDGIFGPDHAQFGAPGWDASGWARFPNAAHVGIAINSSTDAGQVGDVEAGDMTTLGAVAWVRLRRTAGADPSIYVSFDRWQELRDAFAAAGEPEPHWWIARWDDVPVIPDGAVAKQYAGSALTGANFDLSEVADYWPGVDTVVRLDPADPAYIDLQNRLGGLQAFIDPGSGATSTGEVTVRLRDLSGWIGAQGDLRALLLELKADIEAGTPAATAQAIARIEAALKGA